MQDSSPPSDSLIVNALTVDVEEYFQVSAFRDVVSRDEWESMPSRVVRNTRHVLNLFDCHEVISSKNQVIYQVVAVVELHEDAPYRRTLLIS